MKPDAARKMITVGSTHRATRHIREVSLRKRRHRYLFRYEAGREEDIIKVFAEMAADPKQYFDWFDAAVLTYQMARRFEMSAVSLAPSQRSRARRRR